ncbi:HEAT repeat domain-containing protein [Gordonia shandongensis]|uniref:HEAT repeat domain-containing protein n=1 Tax=Gordonia shandongensis TaxID=376351 RepID=UPI000556FC42|nr:HEAT repeat domain-containing protein [Gordonia shandongensis]
MTLEIRRALGAADPSTRLAAALAAGTEPDEDFPRPLVRRCAVEPDFYVRDMLTWALTRHPSAVTVPLLRAELDAPVAQARSQALHTLSKIGDPRTADAVTPALLTDTDDEVARTAWRTAAALWPERRHERLAAILATQFGRGGLAMHRSLSRAFVMLDEAGEWAVHGAHRSADPAVRAHAAATERLMADPESSFTVDGL